MYTLYFKSKGLIKSKTHDDLDELLKFAFDGTYNCTLEMINIKQGKEVIYNKYDLIELYDNYLDEEDDEEENKKEVVRMARVFKLEMYIVDAEGTFENMTPSQVAKELKSTIDYEHWTMSEVSSLQTSKEFEWDDELDINRTVATLDDYEAYFKKED